MMKMRPRISYVIDPRFPGGTSAAVAAELRVTAAFGTLTVHAVESQMFRGRTVAPPLQEAFDDLGLRPVWNAPVISGDIVILHNPAFLKFQQALPARIFCRQLVVVTHENFERPGGAEGFDVARCLAQIERATLALQKTIAPISAHNRATVERWIKARSGFAGWSILSENWSNICAFDRAAPTPVPKDRRGRHSRRGFEKFPALATLDLCFPATAEANTILGADSLMSGHVIRPHWRLLPFRGLDLGQYFEMVDFMVYFTAPTWRESFGRVLAEGIAAGKVVISDPETAATFGAGVIGTHPSEVDAIIARHVAAPDLYRRQVETGQAVLDQFSAERFADVFAGLVARAARKAAA
jgi:hypothetical protein